MADDYILCADDHSLEEAIGALKISPEIMMDCEGERLGRQGGSLSLIIDRPSYDWNQVLEDISLRCHSA